MTKHDEPRQEKATGNNVLDNETLRTSLSKSVKSIKSLKPTRSPNDGRQNRSRKVKFAEPIIHLRLYDRTASPNAATEPVKNPKVNPTALEQLGPALDQLSPPLSLVAHLDLAAKKLHARDQPEQAHAKQYSPSAPVSPQAQQQQQQQQQIASPNKDQQQAINHQNKDKKAKQ